MKRILAGMARFVMLVVCTYLAVQLLGLVLGTLCVASMGLPVVDTESDPQMNFSLLIVGGGLYLTSIPTLIFAIAVSAVAIALRRRSFALPLLMAFGACLTVFLYIWACSWLSWWHPFDRLGTLFLCASLGAAAGGVLVANALCGKRKIQAGALHGTAGRRADTPPNGP